MKCLRVKNVGEMLISDISRPEEARVIVTMNYLKNV